MNIRSFALCALFAGVACHEYAPANPLQPRVEPVRVQFRTPRTVALHRHTDSLLVGVTRLDGTLLWSDRDSLRLGVTGAQTTSGWRAVQAPSDAVIPMQPGIEIEHRVLSKTKTGLVLGAAWVAVVAVIAAALK